MKRDDDPYAANSVIGFNKTADIFEWLPEKQPVEEFASKGHHQTLQILRVESLVTIIRSRTRRLRTVQKILGSHDERCR